MVAMTQMKPQTKHRACVVNNIVHIRLLKIVVDSLNVFVRASIEKFNKQFYLNGITIELTCKAKLRLMN